jgi:hypothetical protein
MGGRKACLRKASRQEFIARLSFRWEFVARSLSQGREGRGGRIVAQVGSRVQMSLGKMPLWKGYQ